MLHDPSKQHPSLNGLISWLKTKDPNQGYSWWDPNTCLVATYIKETGADRAHWTLSDCVGGLYNYRRVAYNKPWIYGAALARAERVALDQVMEYAP